MQGHGRTSVSWDGRSRNKNDEGDEDMTRTPLEVGGVDQIR